MMPGRHSEFAGESHFPIIVALMWTLTSVPVSERTGRKEDPNHF